MSFVLWLIGAGVYALCAYLFYLNELHRPAKDRISDLDTAKALALAWPVLVFGLFIAFIAVTVMRAGLYVLSRLPIHPRLQRLTRTFLHDH